VSVDSLLGARIAGYRIEAQVGRGGMGRVYRASQLSLGRPVALKILSGDLAQDESFRARFLKEAQLAATLEHPNILPIYEVGEDMGLLFMSMRLVDGTDLGSLLRRDGALSSSRTLALLAQAADALDFAHRAGLVHRDVKPANLLLAGDLLYLADFGVAKPVLARRELTNTGVFIGTLDYAAPEQIRNEPLDGAADLYALGCVLFQCLSGRVPFDRDTQFAVMQAHTAEPPPLLSTLRPELPVALDAVISTALAKQKDERFRSGRHLIEAARAAIEGRSPVVAETKFSPLMSLGISPKPLIPPTVVKPQALTTEHASPPPRPRRTGLGGVARMSAALGIISLLVVGGAAAGAVLRPDDSRAFVASLPIPNDGRAFVSRALGLLGPSITPSATALPSAGASPTPFSSPTPPTPTSTTTLTPSPTLTPTQGVVLPTPAATPIPTSISAVAPSIVSLGCSTSATDSSLLSCSPMVTATRDNTSYTWSASPGSPLSQLTASTATFSARFVSNNGMAGASVTLSLQVCNGPVCSSSQQTIGVGSKFAYGVVGYSNGGINFASVARPAFWYRMIQPGQVIQFWVTYRNLGWATWTRGDSETEAQLVFPPNTTATTSMISLGWPYGWQPPAYARQDVPTVAPGENVTLTFSVRGPYVTANTESETFFVVLKLGTSRLFGGADGDFQATVCTIGAQCNFN
jgi:serine/threonine protein kinase